MWSIIQLLARKPRIIFRCFISRVIKSLNFDGGITSNYCCCCLNRLINNYVV